MYDYSRLEKVACDILSIAELGVDVKLSVVSLIIPLPASLLIAMQCLAFAAPNDQYTLGPGDVLSIKHPDATVTQAPVLPDGTMVIDHAGVVDAAGKTIKDVRDIVNDKAKKWFESPNIEVTLERKRSTQVYLLGEVKNPGLYAPASTESSQTPNSSKVEKNFTISKLLEIAGGLKDSANLKCIHVTRLHPRAVINVNLWKLIHDGDLTEDLILQPGDVVYVPKSDTEPGSTGTLRDSSSSTSIRVMGEVVRPGLIVAPDGGLDLATIIARAGGLRDEAVHFVIVAHCAENGSVATEKIALRGMRNLKERRINSGDIVIVKTAKRRTAINDFSAGTKLRGLPKNVPIGDFGGMPQRQIPVGE